MVPLGVRWWTVTRATCLATSGTICTAAAEPTIATCFPVRSASWRYYAEWQLGPSEASTFFT